MLQAEANADNSLWVYPDCDRWPASDTAVGSLTASVWDEKTMLSRSSRWNAREVEQDPNMFLALALGMWNPFLASTLGGNAQAYEGFGLIAREWQAFAARRIKEDFVLVQRLTHGRTPDQILAAYTEFWWKAADDYGNAVRHHDEAHDGCDDQDGHGRSICHRGGRQHERVRNAGSRLILNSSMNAKQATATRASPGRLRRHYRSAFPTDRLLERFANPRGANST